MSADLATDHSAPPLPFDVAVPTDGYRWWYVDGLSDDGRSGLVVIAFVGSVFSPYYYSARARGSGDPENHVAINVGLYRPNGKLWVMTERSRSSLERDAENFRVGPSRLEWVNDRLEIHIDERSAPFARRVRGKITVEPGLLNRESFELDAAGLHRWHPLAPLARIDVQFDEPAWRWQGDAYLDSNAGERPLESDFSSWHWSRGTHAGKSSIAYAVRQRDGSDRALSLEISDSGIEHRPLPPAVDLPSTGWLVRRATNSAVAPTVVRTFEDTPFYARSLLRVDSEGGARHVMHESLSLERFESAWVRTLLPFRMPRRR